MTSGPTPSMLPKSSRPRSETSWAAASRAARWLPTRRRRFSASRLSSGSTSSHSKPRRL